MTIIELAASISALGTAGTLIISALNMGAIRSIHISINSRMDELLKATGVSARAEGLEEGRYERRPAPPEIP